jgi:hypothetical protein
MQSLFSKIETTEQAEKVIREVSILLYGLAALNFLFFSSLSRKACVLDGRVFDLLPDSPPVRR